MSGLHRFRLESQPHKHGADAGGANNPSKLRPTTQFLHLIRHREYSTEKMLDTHHKLASHMAERILNQVASSCQEYRRDNTPTQLVQSLHESAGSSEANALNVAKVSESNGRPKTRNPPHFKMHPAPARKKDNTKESGLELKATTNKRVFAVSFCTTQKRPLQEPHREHEDEQHAAHFKEQLKLERCNERVRQDDVNQHGWRMAVESACQCPLYCSPVHSTTTHEKRCR